MGQFEYAQAGDIFSGLVGQFPNQHDLQVNAAIATLHRQGDGDSDAARAALERVLASDRADVRAHYNLGLILLHDGRAAEALPHLSLVVEKNPTDAFARYFAGQCRFQQSDFAGALGDYERALDINPRLRSAAYGAFQAAQRLGRDSGPMLDRFRELESNPQSELAEFKYTRMGPLAEASTIDQPSAPPVARPAGPVFARTPIQIDALPPSIRWRTPTGITAADIDGDGRIDLFIASAIEEGGAVRNAVLLNRGGLRFTLDRSHPLASVSDVQAALWGDIDNDGLLDVYLCRRGANQLWRQSPAGTWSALPPDAHANGGEGITIDGALVDADHDGDLDVLLIKADGANELLNNNGDGTFRPLGRSIGLADPRRASAGLVLADLDADRDADILAIRKTPPHDVHVNDRSWRYHSDPAFDAIVHSRMSAAVAGDLDADGSVEIYAAGVDGIVEWRRSKTSHAFEPRKIGGTERFANARQLALADVDGDGRIDLIGSTVDGRWQAVALMPGGDANPLHTSEGPPLAAWTVALLDPLRGPSVVGVAAGADQAPVVWQPGAGRFPFVAVTLSGRDPRSRQIRSNLSGIGATLAARTGSRWTALDTYRPQSGGGQSLQPVAIGTGGSAQIDFVSIVWSDGVFQTEVGLAPGTVRTVAETQRQLSSCPVLFAFDGQRFAFVTDLLGVGGLGTQLSPGVYDSPRPRESVLLPETLAASRDGRYALKITEPMEEVAYLDAAQLVAYDLPAGWQLVLDERRTINAPEATGEPRFFRDERLPVRATVSDGGIEQDVTRAAMAVDGIAVPPGRVDPRHIGRTEEHVLVLAFDRPLDAPAGSEAMLVADGWIEYPYAQTLFAAWQAHAEYRAPTIDARGADGVWHVVRDEFGYPAGMPRRISVPLGRLPKGTTELRLRTTQEIYWDRLAVAFAAPCRGCTRHVLPLTSAHVARTGFPKRETTDNRSPSYDYTRRAPLWDVRYPSGFYTAEGAATELVAQADGAVAIIGPGEELGLQFDAALPPPPAGMTRRFVLETRGWCKDMDLYTADGATVEPIPGLRSTAAEQLQRRYTTRYQSGR